MRILLSNPKVLESRARNDKLAQNKRTAASRENEKNSNANSVTSKKKKKEKKEKQQFIFLSPPHLPLNDAWFMIAILSRVCPPRVLHENISRDRGEI